MKFPSIKAISETLRDINSIVDGECDVRLQVYEDGSWAVRYGLSDYDQDHRGYWGASTVPGLNKKGKPSRFNSNDVAKELLSQVKVDYYLSKMIMIYQDHW